MTKARDLGDNAQNTKPKVVNAKADLIVGTGSDAADRLAVGSNGETLVADSSASTGLRWQSNFGAGKNAIINGDFRIWQRGTSFSVGAANTYCADRFIAYVTGATATVSQQSFTPGTAPVSGYESPFFLRIANGAGGTYYELQQRIEDVRTFAGQTITFSFWAKASTTTTAKFFLVQNFGSGGSSNVSSSDATAALTTSWQRFTLTTTLGSMSGKTIGAGSYLAPFFYYSSGTVSSVSIDTWGWQVEAGSVATAFQTATGTLAGELAACQRYHERTFSNDATAGGSKLAVYSDANYVGGIRWQVVKRVAPTVTIFSTNGGTSGNVRQVSNNTNYAISSIDTIGTMGFNLITGVGRSNMVDFHYVADAEL